jgi:hypothetical protein
MGKNTNNKVLLAYLNRVHSKTQFYFLFSFCLAKKKQKPNPPAGGQLLFFITQKAYAAPPKKS